MTGGEEREKKGRLGDGIGVDGRGGQGRRVERMGREGKEGECCAVQKMLKIDPGSKYMYYAAMDANHQPQP